MARFSDLGVEADFVIGKGIEIEELFGQRILIEKTLIEPTKFPGKNSSGLRMQMQVVLATFNDDPDNDGDYFTKDASGKAIGERRSCFTGSDILISSIQKAEKGMMDANITLRQQGKPLINIYPIDTTIEKIGKCFKFT